MNNKDGQNLHGMSNGFENFPGKSAEQFQMYGRVVGENAIFPLLETIVIPRFEDVAVVGDAVQQGRGHIGISEHLHPLGEVEIGGDDQGRLFIELADQIPCDLPIARI